MVEEDRDGEHMFIEYTLHNYFLKLIKYLNLFFFRWKSVIHWIFVKDKCRLIPLNVFEGLS